MSRQGRNPTPYTERQLRVLERELSKGAFLVTAAPFAGVVHRTLERHLALGRAHPEGEWGELARRLDLARAEFDARAVKKLARSRDDRTLQWLLERRDPKRFHLALKVLIERNEDDVLAAVEGAVAEVLSDAEQRAKVLDAVAKRLAALAEGAEVAAAGAAGSAEGA